ncbi:hypothetical protein OG884_33865 [Streptosporangium sp. NBC_01755]|uniref:hypothetical protein n=1 Tax=unclassified Streptosporangium TaxID=2632669 RepID=UPI002DDC7E3E|nr:MULTISPECIES: hypothetical protein [unclassified Streptosporangium]WSA28819.1 hypothetical protein OIE13_13615 [Streptosporangium sp. NBC_01810]WSC99734.1 hypothetical protein OG884_33865 [Streptosporangium sp. NBC_01755]
MDIEYADGRVQPLASERWLRPIEGDEHILARCGGPTLDVGSGPGRLTVALTRMGVPVLGIDVTPLAVNLPRRSSISTSTTWTRCPPTSMAGWRCSATPPTP